MKEQNHRLFSCLYGSGLYGTRTPTSDRDVKHIVLPDIDDLLIGKKVVNAVKKTNTVANTKNGVDDVDEEFIPIQIFAKDFYAGQTYAIELAFALEGGHAEQHIYNHSRFTTSPFIQFVRELRTMFLTSNIKAMMGYVVNQASLYSFKGERLNVAREFLELLNDLNASLTADERLKVSLGECIEPWSCKSANPFTELEQKYPKYFKQTEYNIGNDVMKPCFVLLEKTLPFTNLVPHSIKVVEAIVHKYGSRADAASESNVDWKATMHAMRIVDEGLQILTEHRLVFPFTQDYVDYLLKMKRGELPLDPIKEELSYKLDVLKTLEKTTSLPSATPELNAEFEEWLKDWMRAFYL